MSHEAAMPGQQLSFSASDWLSLSLGPQPCSCHIRIQQLAAAHGHQGPNHHHRGLLQYGHALNVTVHTSQCRLLHCSLRLYTRSFYWPVEQPASLFPRWIRQFALAQGKMWKPAQFLLRWLCRGSPEKNVFLRKQRWKFLERYAIEAVPSAPAAEVSTPNAGSVETEGPWASARLWWLPDHWLPVQTAQQELGVL